MNYSLKSLFRNVLIVLATLCVASCAGVQTQPAKVTVEPGPKFKLSATGLADKGMWKCTPLLTDINRDGHLDVIAISRLGDGAHVWLGDGKGNWKDSSAGLEMKKGSCGGGIAFGEIAKSGRLDLAVADHCTGVYVYLQQPDGSWKAVVEGFYPPVVDANVPLQDEATRVLFIGSEDLALGDINGDGCLDIVSAASDQGGFAVYSGDCTGKNWKQLQKNGLPDNENPEPEDEDRAGWANRVMMLDINKDGQLDVVASYYKGPRVWLGDGKGHFKSASLGLPSPQIGGLYRGLAYGDVNKDGLLDLVTANDVNGPELYLQQRDGTWNYTGDIMPALQNGALGVALGDFTKSGNLDILVAGRRMPDIGSNYGLFLLKGDGKGNFKELQTNLPANGLSVTWGVATGDVNEDGLLDLVATTGGAVTGGGPGKAALSRSGRGKIGKPDAMHPGAIPELPLPHMQVWVNEGMK
jgi:hypothetical protein